MRPSVFLSVCPSVCLSHAATTSKRCKLGSQNFQCGQPQELQSNQTHRLRWERHATCSIDSRRRRSATNVHVTNPHCLFIFLSLRASMNGAISFEPVIPRLHGQAGSTSCYMLAERARSMFVRYLFDRVNGVLAGTYRATEHSIDRRTILGLGLRSSILGGIRPTSP